MTEPIQMLSFPLCGKIPDVDDPKLCRSCPFVEIAGVWEANCLGCGTKVYASSRIEAMQQWNVRSKAWAGIRFFSLAFLKS